MKNLLKFLFFLTIISGIVWACAKEKENTVPIEIASPVVENLTPNANGDIVVPIDDMIKEAGIRAGGYCPVSIKFECSKVTIPGFGDPGNPCFVTMPYQVPNCEFACRITATGNATVYDKMWHGAPSPTAIIAAQNALPNLPAGCSNPIITNLASLNPLTDAAWTDNDVIILPISPSPNSITIYNTAKAKNSGNLDTPWITGSIAGSFVRWTFSIKGSTIKKVYTMTAVKPNATNPYPGTSYKVQNCSF